MHSAFPVVGIPVDVKTIDPHPYHVVGEKYVDAVARGAGCFPLLIPALGAGKDLGDLSGIYDPVEIVRALDGLMFPGSHSDVAPSHYGVSERHPATDLDPQRDATTLPLLQAAIREAVPVLALCRGFQELNVARGGSINQALHETAGRLDHREPDGVSREQKYAPAHDVSITSGGLLHDISGQLDARVNSLHRQGTDRLGDGLRVEATAPDGLIEAVSLVDAQGFLLGVQWHPEWRWWEDTLSTSIFAAFGEAVRARHGARQAGA